MIATQEDAARPRPQGRRRARLPGQADAAAPRSRRRRSTARSTSSASASTSSASPSRRSSARAATRSPSACPTSRTPARAEQQVGTTAQLYFYDWEPNVLGAERQAGARRTPTGHRRTRSAGSQRVGLTRVRGGPARRQDARRAAQDGHDREHGCTPQQVAAASTAATTCSTPTHEKVARRARRTREPNLLSRSSTRRAAGRAAKARRASTRARRARAGAPDEAPTARSPNERPDSWLRAQRQPGAARHRHQEPGAELRRRRGGTGAPIVTFKFTGNGKTRSSRRHARDRPARPGSAAAGRRPGTALQHFAVVLDDELISAPYIDYRRTRTASTAATARRSRAASRSRSRRTSRACSRRRAADQARADLAVAGVGDARQAGAAPGPDRGPRRLRVVVLFLLALLPRARRDRDRRRCVIYAIYFFALIKLIPITLTLPGIAGLILTIGVAADANIVIFERVKEEMRARQVGDPAASPTGYKRASRRSSTRTS